MSGKRLLTSLLVDPKGTEKYLGMGLHEGLFRGPEVELFEDIQTHVDKYGSLPKPGTVDVAVPEELETPEYYLSDVVSRFTHRTIVTTMKAAQIELTEKAPEVALDLFREMLIDLTARNNANQIVDFASDGATLLDQEYFQLTKSHLMPGVYTGYPTLDAMLGTLRGGDIMSIVGRPSQGKTYQLLRMAHHAWHYQAKRVMFVSMEMKPLALIQRITAMHQKMSITLLRKGEILKKKHKKILADMHELETSHEKFWIVDGNLTSKASDIVMLCHQMKPDILYIDGAYMLQIDDRRAPRYERIASSLETVKSEIATRQGVPSVLSYQFNKKGAKEKELENIGGSDAVGQISSCVLALFEKEMGSVENIVKKKVNIMKGRNGEEGEFYINWIFDTPPFMDFSEIVPKKTAEAFVYV